MQSESVQLIATPSAPLHAGVFHPEELKHMRGLHETIVELAQLAQFVGYRPVDSREFASNVIDWAIEWEALFWAEVGKGTWFDDDWIEQTEAFGLRKLAEVCEDCTNWCGRA